MSRRQQEAEELTDGGIDAGLLLLSALTPPGQTRSLGEIAYVCGVAKGSIWHIERNALRKLRRVLKRRDDIRELLEFNERKTYRPPFRFEG